MPQDPIGLVQTPSQAAHGFAAIRAAEALLRTLGGGSVYVRVPMDAATSGDSSQLGLQAAATEDVELSPVVVSRPLRRHKEPPRVVELTISAAGLTRAKDIQDEASAQQFFDSALGVFHAGKLWRIVRLQVEEFGGVPYLYRVTVSE